LIKKTVYQGEGMKSALLLIAVLFSCSAFAADVVKSVKVPAPQTAAPEYGVRMDGVCYNPNYGLGAYQTCQDDLQVLDLMSNPGITLIGQCNYVAACGPFTTPTYELDVIGYVGR
jgi:hypothetical protein